MYPGAEYVTHNLQAYDIVQESSGFWVVKRYQAGALPPHLKGRYTSFGDCERDLVAHIKSRDKFREATYPGCPEHKRINYIELSLKDLSPKRLRSLSPRMRQLLKTTA